MSKSKVSKPNDIKYLGFGFFKDSNDGLWKAKPHDKSVQKLSRKLKELTKRSWSVIMDHRLLKIKQLIIGWSNYFRIGHWWNMAIKLDKHVRFRLRMCIWKQWKVAKARMHVLIKLGDSKSQARRRAYSRKSYARCAYTFLRYSITNDRLKKRGLVSLLDQYQLKHYVLV